MKPYFETELGKLYNGDCLEVMDYLINQGIKVNNIITSPPYNMTKRKGGYADKSERYDNYKDWIPYNQYIDWTLKLFQKYNFILENNGNILYNFGYSIENPLLPYELVAGIVKQTNFELIDTIIWKKKNGVPFPANKYRLSRNWEFIFVFVKKGYSNNYLNNRQIIKKSDKTQQNYYKNTYNFIEAKNNDEVTYLNKATFSSDLIKELIDIYVDEKSVVLDSFNGTGTTFKACEIKNRKYIGIELSEDQCEYTINRISKGIQQTLL